MSCNICGENYNKSTRLAVSCDDCSFESCRECISKYMEGLSTELNCMNCKKVWNRVFVLKNMTKSWVRYKYLKHNQNILANRELETISNFVPVVETEDRLDSNRIQYYRNMELIQDLRNKQRELKESINEDKRFLKTFVEDHQETNGMCPIRNCNGFINLNWKCIACHTKICNTCREPEHGETGCNPEILASIEELKKDTKPCPKCKVPIHRIEGCYQMWCTHCKTPFDWTNGTVITSLTNYHNPHFQESFQNTVFNEINLLYNIPNCHHILTLLNALNVYTRNVNKPHEIFRNRMQKLKSKYLRTKITKEKFADYCRRIATDRDLAIEERTLVTQFSNSVRTFTNTMMIFDGNTVPQQNIDVFRLSTEQEATNTFEKWKELRISYFRQVKRFNDIWQVTKINNPFSRPQ